MGRLERSLKDSTPDLLVPVDFPDFNLSLARRAGKVGVPVVYFVSPQVWAWRKSRVKTIGERVRRMLVLFPPGYPLIAALFPRRDDPDGVRADRTQFRARVSQLCW